MGVRSISMGNDLPNFPNHPSSMHFPGQYLHLAVGAFRNSPAAIARARYSAMHV